MAVQIAAMIVGLLLVSAASLWGLNALYAGYGQAWKGYELLKFVNDVRTDLQVADSLLRVLEPQREDARANVLVARNKFLLGETDLVGEGYEQQKESIRAGLADAEAQLKNDDGRSDDTEGKQKQRDIEKVNAVFKQVEALSNQIRQSIEAKESARWTSVRRR